MEVASPVLVVDDDSSLRLLFTRALAREGFAVLEAASGEEALAILAVSEVGVVLLDSNLPGLSGREVLAAIRGRVETALLPVLMVTGEDELASRIGGLDAGASDYVIKPVEPVELVARVRAQLRTRDVLGASAQAALARRLELLAGLYRLPVEGGAEQIGNGITDFLCSALIGIDDAQLYRFTGVEGVTHLAGSSVTGGRTSSGRMLAPVEARTMRSLAKAGPAILSGPTVGESTLGYSLALRVVAPLGTPERPLGLLELRTDGSGNLPGYQSISVAIDAASAATLLLAPLIERDTIVELARQRIRSDLEAGSYKMVYQPVVELASGRILGYEALARFSDGCSPIEHLEEAAAAGIRFELEAALARAALEAAPLLPEGCFLAVNASPGFAASGTGLAELLETADCPVVIELTENERVEDYEALRSFLAPLSSRVRVAVDDAGAGYSSLAHVFELRPDLVKLDRTWVAGVDTDEPRQALVGALVGFAKRVGCRLVAEGIETRAELDTLVDLGVDLGQGYLLGRPEPLVAAAN